ncbi:MAG: serpin family protein [Oscillospiraceae bacterium]|nr:serpin family protein [Oscillospiraceae bacterium]
MRSNTKRWLAGLLAVFSLFTGGCSARHSDVPSVPVQPLAQVPYPQMAPYPEESAFIDSRTGEFDSDGFQEVYSAWRQDRQNQRNQPEGYADDLHPFFAAAVPAILTADVENPLCSPLNLYLALAMLAETAAGTSRQQILDTLGAEGIDALRAQAGQVWNAHYCADSASSSVLANSLWLDEGCSYSPEVVSLLAKQYYASVFQGDLGSAEMNQALGSWLSEQTGGLLEEQAKQVQLDPDTVLALASTILFRAKWDTEFSEANNTQATFHSPTGDREVTFLNRELSYGPYCWGEDFGAVSLPLEDGSRMWLFLPDAGKSPQQLLENGHVLALTLQGGPDSENQAGIRVNLSLPKFDVTADLQLKPSLQDLGITQVFDPGTADFTAILPDSPAWLSKVQHAARVKIDEEGVYAAAYTVMMECGAARPPEDEIDFILDRPFLFIISSHDNLPLFAGIVNHP